MGAGGRDRDAAWTFKWFEVISFLCLASTVLFVLANAAVRPAVIKLSRSSHRLHNSRLVQESVENKEE